MEVPSANSGLLWPVACPGPGQRHWSGVHLEGPGCHQLTSLQLFAAPPASPGNWSRLTAESAAGILEDLHTPSWFVSAMKRV